MINNLQLLRNVGRFDSVNAAANTPLSRLTLIYAENGRGKTALAAILRSLATADEGETPTATWIVGSAGIPERYGAGRVRLFYNFCGAWSVDLGDERRFVLFQKSEDAVTGCNEGAGKVGIGCMADDDQQANAMSNDRRQFIGFIADAAIVSDGCPPASADLFEPVGIGTVVREMVCVAFDVKTGSGENFRKFFSEIAIGEKDVGHAIRS